MKTINFKGNENLNTDIGQTAANIMEKYSGDNTISVEYDGDNIIEHRSDETIYWSIVNINRYDDGIIENVQIDC